MNQISVKIRFCILTETIELYVRCVLHVYMLDTMRTSY